MASGNTIEIYTNQSMVKPEHIKEIDNQLKNMGSKVPKELVEDKKEHSLANILQLACGAGSFSVKSEKINSIKTNEFELNCD